MTTEAEPNTVNGLALQRERLMNAVSEIRGYSKDPAMTRKLQDAERRIRNLEQKG